MSRRLRIPLLLFILCLLCGRSAFDHHEAGGYYSGLQKVGDRERENYGPSGPIGVGALFIGVTDTLRAYVFNPIDFAATFVLETFLLPYDYFHHDEFLRTDGLRRARAMKRLSYSLQVYENGYMADSSPLADAVVRKAPLSEMQALLASDVSPDSTDEFGYSAFDYAVASGNLEAVRWLLEEQGVSMNPAAVVETTQYGLMQEDMLAYLLSRGLDPNAADEDGDMLLFLVARYEGNRMSKLLLEHGADINSSGDDGKTALLMAVRYDDTELVKLLMQRGADVAAKNAQGENALFYASGDTVALLVEAGLDINERNRKGDTPLTGAMSWLYSDDARAAARVAAYLEAGADPNIPNDYGTTPLMKTAVNGYERGAELLIAAGAELNVQNRDGVTALMYALMHEHHGIAEMLLKAGASATLHDKTRRTAYSLAETSEGRELLKRYAAETSAGPVAGQRRR